MPDPYRLFTRDMTDPSPVRKLFRGETLAVDPDTLTIKHFITTAHIDRYGEVLEPDGAILENFLAARGPVLYAHGWGGTGRGGLPIGGCLGLKTGTSRGQPGIIAETRFFVPKMEGVTDAFPKLLFDMWQQEVIRGTSVGFLPVLCCRKEHKVDDLPDYITPPPSDPETGDAVEVVSILHYKRWEPLEYSICGVPANPGVVGADAEAAVQSLDIRDFIEDAIGRGDISPEELARLFPPGPAGPKERTTASVLDFLSAPAETGSTRSGALDFQTIKLAN